MPFTSAHQTAVDYAEARKRGDWQTADRLHGEAIARFATGTTDGTELTDFARATLESLRECRACDLDSVLEGGRGGLTAH